jgi:PAS domain-containing protein
MKTIDKLALRKSEERFRLVVESAPNAIVMIGPTGLIEMVNAQTERVFGYSRNERQTAASRPGRPGRVAPGATPRSTQPSMASSRSSISGGLSWERGTQVVMMLVLM